MDCEKLLEALTQKEDSFIVLHLLSLESPAATLTVSPDIVHQL
jgi:hypothetical protein